MSVMDRLLPHKRDDTAPAGDHVDRVDGFAASSPVPLARAELRRKLGRLPDWTGDEHALRRELNVPPEELGDTTEFLERVIEVSGHGGRISTYGDHLTVELHTESAGGVTSYDLALAQRSDHALLDARVLGGGHVHRIPT